LVDIQTLIDDEDARHQYLLAINQDLLEGKNPTPVKVVAAADRRALRRSHRAYRRRLEYKRERAIVGLALFLQRPAPVK